MKKFNLKNRNKGSGKWKYAKAALVTGVIGLASVGGVSAYLTDYDTADNEFTVGKVDIELNEPDWKPEEQTSIEPGKEIPKNPQVKNTGLNDAYVYLEVSVPVAEVETANEDGTRLEKKEQELFSFNMDENWTLLKSVRNGNNQVYTCAYNRILKPEETTKALFEKMTFLNIIEGQLDGQKLEVPVRSYAIQASYTGGDAETIPEKAKAAFEKYINQNNNQDGQVTGISTANENG